MSSNLRKPSPPYIAQEIGADAAARVLDVSPKEVERLVESGELEGRLTHRGRVRVDAASLGRLTRSR